MGTRNLTFVVSGGQFVVAQYGQWDGYPEGQGVCILKTLRSLDLADFKNKVSSLGKPYPATELDAVCKEKNINGTLDAFFKEHPYLSRDMGGDIIEFIAKSSQPENIRLFLNVDFAASSLFCEWAYVIDLDKGVFEVYKGFNKRKLAESQRFFFLTQKSEEAFKEFGSRKGSMYYPIRKTKSFKLKNLPTEEEFLNFFKPKDEE